MNTALAAPLAAHDNPRAARWIGRVLTGLIALFLVVDAAAKIALVPAVLEASRKLGIDPNAIRPMGIVLLVSTLLHLYRRTQLLGAVLVTTYLGGAVCAHVFSGTSFTFAVGMGVLLWIAYALRSASLRAFVRSDLLGR